MYGNQHTTGVNMQQNCRLKIKTSGVIGGYFDDVIFNNEKCLKVPMRII